MSELNDDSLLAKNRIEALCDGIFAITMTILILELKTPENIPYNLAPEELPGILMDLLPSVEAYLISFLVLGIFWLRHQIQFKYLKYTDRMILSINVLFLLFTGFVPFSVGLVMRYPNVRLTFVIYILNLLVISLIMFWQWNYITRTPKISVNIDKELARKFNWLTFVPVTIFALSFIVSFFNVRVAFLLIYLDPIFYGAYRSFKNRKARLTP